MGIEVMAVAVYGKTNEEGSLDATQWTLDGEAQASARMITTEIGTDTLNANIPTTEDVDCSGPVQPYQTCGCAGCLLWYVPVHSIPCWGKASSEAVDKCSSVAWEPVEPGLGPKTVTWDSETCGVGNSPGVEQLGYTSSAGHDTHSKSSEEVAPEEWGELEVALKERVVDSLTVVNTLQMHAVLGEQCTDSHCWTVVACDWVDVDESPDETADCPGDLFKSATNSTDAVSPWVEVVKMGTKETNQWEGCTVPVSYEPLSLVTGVARVELVPWGWAHPLVGWELSSMSWS